MCRTASWTAILTGDWRGDVSQLLVGSKHVGGVGDGGAGPCMKPSSHELHSCPKVQLIGHGISPPTHLTFACSRQRRSAPDPSRAMLLCSQPHISERLSRSMPTALLRTSALHHIALMRAEPQKSSLRCRGTCRARCRSETSDYRTGQL